MTREEELRECLEKLIDSIERYVPHHVYSLMPDYWKAKKTLKRIKQDG